MILKNAYLAKSMALFLMIANILIWTDFPILRPLFSFLAYSVIPGFLILNLFNIAQTSLLKKLALSIPLSLSFLLLAGLVLNTFLISVSIQKPLSVSYLLVFLNFLIIILIYMNSFQMNNQTKYPICLFHNSCIGDKLVSPLIFLFIIPILSIFGMHLMNTFQINYVLLLLFFLIPTYVFFITVFPTKIMPINYPLSIFFIGLSLTLMHGLNTNYLNGVDVYLEYASSQATFHSHALNISQNSDLLTATLSVSLLPALFQSLLGMDGLSIFKVIFPIIISFIPLLSFYTFNIFFKSTIAHLSAFYLLSQVTFIYTLQSAFREGLALLFFVSAILVLYDSAFKSSTKKCLIIIFFISIVVSHYTTAYILLFYVVSYLLLTKMYFIRNYVFKEHLVTYPLILILFIFIFAWYLQITTTATGHVLFLNNIIRSMADLLVKDLERSEAYPIIGIGVTNSVLIVRAIINDIAFVLIGIGVIGWVYDSIKEYNSSLKSQLDGGFLLMVVISSSLITSLLIIPQLNMYGSGRFFQQSLIFLAPTLIYGGILLMKRLSLKWSIVLPLVVVILCFFNSVYLTDYLMGENTSPDLNRNSYRNGIFNVNDEEIYAGIWMQNYISENRIISSDKFGPLSLIVVYQKFPDNIDRTLFYSKEVNMNSDYIFLRKFNIINREVYNSTTTSNITEFNYLFAHKNKIFNNGGALVWK